MSADARPLTSAVESARFGFDVARLIVDGAALDAMGDDRLAAAAIAGAAEHGGHDVVILRHPADRVGLFAALEATWHGATIYADTLMYWEWAAQRDLPASVSSPAGMRLVDDLDRSMLAEQVADVFADYPNHYAANPVFSRQAALAGYVEWVERAVDDGADWCALVDATDAVVAFAVTDLHGRLPDILLAGVSSNSRGQGHYRALVGALMSRANDRGWAGVAISTQAHNVAVQSTWASLGWRPTRAVTTVHLVRPGMPVAGA